MADEAAGEGGVGREEPGAAGAEGGAARSGIPEDAAAEGPGGQSDEFPHFLEVFNDYDPSMRFTAVFPVGEEQGAAASSVAYYIIEPGKHTGVHSDNAEEIFFVTEGSGEMFVAGRTEKLEPGRFHVIAAGLDHDIYAQGGTALRMLSFFPTTEVLSTFQQVVYPVGGNVLSSKPPRPIVTELDPDNLPEGFPFDLAELGLAPAEEHRPPTMTERLVGIAPDEPAASPEPDVAADGARASEPGAPSDAALEEDG